MDSQLFLLLICFYGVILFAVAWLAERFTHRIQLPWWRPLIYALSIGVYCSSWTFLGAVGLAAEDGWNYLPIYLGPILLIVFGWPFVRRLLIISSRNKVTSIADFIGSRYGKSQYLAAIVTVVVVVGTLPYIALQLRGVGIVWENIDGYQEGVKSFDSASSLLVAMVMAWFAIIFGTRIIDGPNRLKGMITAVAVESVVKLLAFVVVGFLAIQLLLSENIFAFQLAPSFQLEQFVSPVFWTEMLLAGSAIVCLPRQFHVMFVEYQQRSDLRFVRWLVPLYLALFALLVIPLVQSGEQLLAGSGVLPDSYVLALPQWVQSEGILSLAVLGAISAATGMVIVATIALSIMVSNELIVPVWLRFSSRRQQSASDLGSSLRLIRRVAIVILLLLGWMLERLMNNVEGLASMGLISFAASAQLVPALLASLYWPKAHARGVISGLLVGIALWIYCLLLPAILTAEHSLVVNGLFGFGWLSPYDLFGTGGLDPLSHGVMWSVGLNVLAFYIVSKRSSFSALDLRQASLFTRIRRSMRKQRIDIEPSGVEVRQLQALVEPLFGDVRTQLVWQEFERQIGHRLLPHDQMPKFAVQTIEADLAAIIGAVSAHKAIELLLTQQPLKLQDFVSLVGGSSRQIQFSQTLLQTTLETIPQGICVVDKDLKLVAWNGHYQEMFDYPKRLLYVGCDIGKIYLFNAERGYFAIDDRDVAQAVERRLEQLRSGESHSLERELPTGMVVQIKGAPLNNGGYVTTYTDVSEYHQLVDQLESAKVNLETRVNFRTKELREVNQSLKRENLLRARIEKELQEVHGSKSRFIAAASHDLLQPINAARLFVSSLHNKINHKDDDDLLEDIEHLDAALSSSEQLISSLREISRLGSGKERPRWENFSMQALLQPLAQEASALAVNQNIIFRAVKCSAWGYSDPHLLRRVIQNFISNALRYTKSGRILLGCRRHKGLIMVEVWDTGVGIAKQDQEKIFEEFERLPGSSSGNQGLGLGLSIAQRIAHLLGHKISVKSDIGKGSVFRIAIPAGEPQQEVVNTKTVSDPHLGGLNVLCVDNEPAILAGMQSLLKQWGCQVTIATDLGQALNNWSQSKIPDLILADYHLDIETGLDVLEALSYHWNQKLTAIVISADNSDKLIEQVSQAGFLYLSKPVHPAALRNLMRKALRLRARD